MAIGAGRKVGARATIAALLIAGAVVGTAGSQELGANATALARLEQRIDRELTTQGPFTTYFMAVREVYPVEYRRMVAKMAAEAKPDGSISDETFRDAMSEISTLRAKYAVALHRAPNAELVALAEKRAEVLRLARSADVDYCGAIGIEIFNLAPAPTGRRLREAAAELEVAMMRAAKAAYDNPLQRGAIAETDIQAFGEALVAAGGTQRMFDGLRGDRALSKRETCDAANVVYRALETLPARQMAAMMADMMQTELLARADRAEQDAAAGRRTTPTPRQEAFEALLAESVYAPIYAALRDSFPDGYAEMRTGAIAALQKDKTIDEVEAGMLDAALFVTARGSESLGTASDATLVELMRRRGEVLRLMKGKDPKACVAFAEAFFYGASEDLPEAVNLALIAYNAAQLKAIGSAASAPIERGRLSEAEMDGLMERLSETGISDAALAGLLEGELEGLPERARCDAVIALNDAILAMPARAAATLAGRLLSQTALQDPALEEALALLEEDADVEETKEASATPAKAEQSPVLALFDTIRSNFPNSMGPIIAAIGTGDEIDDARLAVAVEQFYSANARYLSTAPDSALIDAGRKYATLLKMLHDEGPKSCAIAAGDMRLDSPFSDAAGKAYVASMISVVRAMAAGRDTPVRRGPPSDSDQLSFARGMIAQGLTLEDIESFGDLPDDEACEYMGMVLLGMADAPSASAGRGLAPLLTGVFQPPAKKSGETRG